MLQYPADVAKHRTPLQKMVTRLMAQGLPISHDDLMLAVPTNEAFDRPGWVFELKYDGFRCLAIRDTDRVRLFTRRGNPLETCFPEIVRCLLDLTPKRLVLDGELVVLDEAGKPESTVFAVEPGRRSALT